MTALDLACDTCLDLRANGRRSTGGPIHCRDCHQTWTGNEAQHCTRCHTTFATIADADGHHHQKPRIAPSVGRRRHANPSDAYRQPNPPRDGLQQLPEPSQENGQVRA